VAVSTLERLAFSFQATVPARHAAAAEPTFANAPFSEPRDWGYTGLLAFTAVLFFRPQDDIPALGAVRIAELCAIAGIAPMILHRLARRLPVFRVTQESIAVFLLGGVMLATAPFSIWPGGAISLFFETFAKVLIVFVLILNTVTTPRRLEQVTWLVLMAGGYVAARGVFDYARGANLIEGGRLAGAIGGIFGNPNDLALNLVAMLPIGFVAALSRRHSLQWRAVAGVFVLMMMATIIFTKSRGGLIGLVVVLLALLVVSRRVRPVIAIGLLGGTLVATPFLPASFYHRMSTIFDAEEDAAEFTGSREARTTLMKEGLRTFAEHPLTGVGLGQFRNYVFPERKERWREAHNALIQVAADLGILGLALFAFLLYRALRTALWLRKVLGPQPRRRDPPPGVQLLDPTDRELLHDHAVAMSAALIGWFACAMFASVAYAWTIYYLIALTVAGRELIFDRVAAAHAAQTGRTRQRVRHALGAVAEPA
jgi:putative inorganic carbon (hco3(-)) transporter